MTVTKPNHTEILENCVIRIRPTMRARGRLDSLRFLALFMALGFIHFVSESRPSSRRYRLLQLSSAETKFF